MSKLLALEYLNLHKEHCETTVLYGDDADRTTLNELKEAIEWVKKQPNN